MGKCFDEVTCSQIIGEAIEYWIDDDWYVGKLQEVPGVFSQGETLEELEDNIRDAFALVMEEQLSHSRPQSETKETLVNAA